MVPERYVELLIFLKKTGKNEIQAKRSIIKSGDKNTNKPIIF